jgi:uncharacterized protein
MADKAPAHGHFSIPESHPLGQRPYFFDGGIRFECKQCGQCCTGDPGLVRVSEKEILVICGFLEMGFTEFADRYLHSYGGWQVIREDRDGRCLFYENGCRIYGVRPLQCRTFPFWMKYLRSEKAFRTLKPSCSGLGKGRLFSKDEILAILVD